MASDNSIAQLGETLDGWCEEFFAMLDSEDRVAQSKALLKGVEIMKELDRIKAKGITSISNLLDRQDWSSTEERVQSLIQGFELASKLADTLSDELMDVDGHNKVVSLANRIADALDSISPDRRAVLAPLLDHPDAGVRASAGAYLVKTMPDRALSVLRDVVEKERGNSAHFTAYFAIRRWEVDGNKA